MIVAGDDLTYGKPHPEGYLLRGCAARCRTRTCVVIEDADAVRAALAAGCHVLALGPTRPVLDDVRVTPIASLDDLVLATPAGATPVRITAADRAP